MLYGLKVRALWCKPNVVVRQLFTVITVNNEIAVIVIVVGRVSVKVHRGDIVAEPKYNFGRLKELGHFPRERGRLHGLV